MLPFSPPNQLRDCRLSDAVSLAYFALRWTIRLLPNKQYLASLRFGDLAVHMRLSMRTAISAFGYAIEDIIQILPKPEMRWITARGIIASVEHINPVWDDALNKRPRQPVSLPYPFAIPCRAISAAILGLLPWPAGIGPSRLVYLRPKLLNGRCSEVCVAMVAEAAIMFIAQTSSLVPFRASTDFAYPHGEEFTSFGNKDQQ